MNNFWQNNNPFFILAPMEDVTDTVFRELVMSVSDASVLNVVFSEFTNVDGLLNEKGFERVAERLIVSASEKALLNDRNTKLVAQIWGNDPEKFKKVAQFLSGLNRFHGIDINMGCPVKKVVKKQTCSALIQVPDLAKEIIYATMEGSLLPVSVKTRIGFNEIETEQWIPHILETKPAALTIHGRIQKQQSTGLANWDEIGKAAILRNELSPETKIIGNGDVESYTQGIDNINTHKIDGVMVGRGIFKNPWMFNKQATNIDINERLRLLKYHISLYQQTWGTCKNYNILKRFFKIYVNEFRGAAQLRAQLMETKIYDEALAIIENNSSMNNSEFSL